MTWQIRSFKFELKKLFYDAEKNEQVFTGILDTLSEDWGIFDINAKLKFGPDGYSGRHIPLLYNHNVERPIGCASLNQIVHWYPWSHAAKSFATQTGKRFPIQRLPKCAWDLEMAGHLILENNRELRILFYKYGYDDTPPPSETRLEKATEISDRLKKEGQNAITTISLGYNVEIRKCGEIIRIYEISIEGKK